VHNLEILLNERISAGLKRKTVTTCSKWAESYRVMGQPFPGPWNFKHHPWAKDMHDCTNEMVIGQKAAQMGYTEVALNWVFKAIDVDAKSVLYVLPATTPDASDFSSSRFDPALELSTHLQNLFSDVKNVGHKRAGDANFYIRGSRSRSQMKSIPAALLIFDEVDEMNQDNIPLAFERASGQIDKQFFLLSTPTIDNFGINFYFIQSTQDHYYFRCPHCNKYTELIYPDCLVITGETLTDEELKNSHLICKECKIKLEHKTKTEWLGLDNSKWVSTHANRDSRGFYINQLYSMTMEPYKLAQSFIRAQSNPADEQEFYNSKLGQTHVVEGARVLDEHIENCKGTHKKKMESKGSKFTTMGIDVGKWLHYVIEEWTFDSNIQFNDINLMSTVKLIQEDKLAHFEELDDVMHRYGVLFAVCDAQPERRKALEFAQRFWGRVKLCFYGNSMNGKQIHVHEESEHTITVDRTAWLDLSLGRFRSGRITLPMDISKEYQQNIKAPVRIYEKDRNGNPVGRYVRGNEEDHFAHSRNYSEIAFPLGAGLSVSQNIGDVY